MLPGQNPTASLPTQQAGTTTKISGLKTQVTTFKREGSKLVTTSKLTSQFVCKDLLTEDKTQPIETLVVTPPVPQGLFAGLLEATLQMKKLTHLELVDGVLSDENLGEFIQHLLNHYLKEAEYLHLKSLNLDGNNFNDQSLALLDNFTASTGIEVDVTANRRKNLEYKLENCKRLLEDKIISDESFEKIDKNLQHIENHAKVFFDKKLPSEEAAKAFLKKIYLVRLLFILRQIQVANSIESCKLLELNLQGLARKIKDNLGESKGIKFDEVILIRLYKQFLFVQAGKKQLAENLGRLLKYIEDKFLHFVSHEIGKQEIYSALLEAAKICLQDKTTISIEMKLHVKYFLKEFNDRFPNKVARDLIAQLDLIEIKTQIKNCIAYSLKKTVESIEKSTQKDDLEIQEILRSISQANSSKDILTLIQNKKKILSAAILGTWRYSDLITALEVAESLLNLEDKKPEAKQAEQKEFSADSLMAMLLHEINMGHPAPADFKQAPLSMPFRVVNAKTPPPTLLRAVFNSSGILKMLIRSIGNASKAAVTCKVFSSIHNCQTAFFKSHAEQMAKFHTFGEQEYFQESITLAYAQWRRNFGIAESISIEQFCRVSWDFLQPMLKQKHYYFAGLMQHHLEALARIYLFNEKDQNRMTLVHFCHAFTVFNIPFFGTQEGKAQGKTPLAQQIALLTQSLKCLMEREEKTPMPKFIALPLCTSREEAEKRLDKKGNFTLLLNVGHASYDDRRSVISEGLQLIVFLNAGKEFTSMPLLSPHFQPALFFDFLVSTVAALENPRDLGPRQMPHP